MQVLAVVLPIHFHGVYVLLLTTLLKSVVNNLDDQFRVVITILYGGDQCLYVRYTGAFFCVNMVLITLSSFLSATVINLYMRTDKKNKVPVWLRKVSYYSCIVRPPTCHC